jgi:signal transduction histidine kinase
MLMDKKVVDRLQNLIRLDEESQHVEIAKNYSLAVAAATTIVLLSALTLAFFGYISIFIFFFPFTVLSAWYSGRNCGITTALLSGLFFILYFFVLTHPAVPNWVLPIILILTVEGVFISILMYFSKNSEELQKLQDENKEYVTLIKHLDLKIKSAENEILARDEFLSIATHELKTPLTSILLQLQTVLHNIRNVSLANFSVEKLLKMIESTEQQSNRLSKMINDLLNVSLITTGRLELEVEEFDLAEVVREVVDRFSEKIKRESYEITVHAKDSIKGTWDKVRIEQVITNLITNAIKYGDNKPISVTVTKDHSTATIRVVDEGIGIHPDKVSNVFGRFQRAIASNNYQGLGVGLYITHQIVIAHGGKITVESRLGSGSEFTVTLPLQTKERPKIETV